MGVGISAGTFGGSRMNGSKKSSKKLDPGFTSQSRPKTTVDSWLDAMDKVAEENSMQRSLG